MSERMDRGPESRGIGARARDAAEREFLEPGAPPPGARLEEAEARLAELLQREIGVPIGEPGAASATGASRTIAQRRPASGRGRSQTMLAVAATIVAVAGVSWIAFMQQAARAPHQPVVRGTTESPGSWDARPVAETMVTGAVRLLWHSAPGATSYTVVFLSPDLSEFARVSALADTSILLSPDARPATIPAGTRGLWRVDAYAGGDVLGRSPASPITFP